MFKVPNVERSAAESFRHALVDMLKDKTPGTGCTCNLPGSVHPVAIPPTKNKVSLAVVYAPS